MSEFDWKNTSYPCLGKTIDNIIVCFIGYETGYLVKGENSMQEIGHYSYRWDMQEFKPFQSPKVPKERVKLWYWEVKEKNGPWYINTQRFSEDTIDRLSDKTYRKIEALGFIYEE